MQSISVMPNHLSAQNNAQQLVHNAKIIGECYRVRVLFDTEANKHDKDYIAIIEDTWLRAFKDTEPKLLAEAVHEFVISDKKGFLPKPGQIVELLVKSTKDIQQRKHFAYLERLERQFMQQSQEGLYSEGTN